MDLAPLLQPAATRILVILMDGLGGFPSEDRGTELEDARTPNLDALAAEGVTGLADVVAPGITPGSGPGHLALFGYDPLSFELGRGALSAAGLEVELRPGDVAARGNLCTLDPAGVIIDRRAGRIASAAAAPLVQRLQDGVRIDGVEAQFAHEREHRILVVLRGENLDPRVTDTDPQLTGVPPRAPEAMDPAAAHTAEVVAELDRQVRAVLAGEAANAVLLRGFDSHTEMPTMSDRYGLRASAVAIYPMYRGISRLLGMQVLDRPRDLAHQVQLVGRALDESDYVFMHHKATDAAGEDGDRDAKMRAIEAVDDVIPDLRALGPDLIMVTGDHATPPQLRAHSWHPVPVLMWGAHAGRDDVTSFGERACRGGLLGWRRLADMMPILLAASGRVAKYGA